MNSCFTRLQSKKCGLGNPLTPENCKKPCELIMASPRKAFPKVGLLRWYLVFFAGLSAASCCFLLRIGCEKTKFVEKCQREKKTPKCSFSYYVALITFTFTFNPNDPPLDTFEFVLIFCWACHGTWSQSTPWSPHRKAKGYQTLQ